MTKRHLLPLIALGLLLPLSAGAQQRPSDHAAHHASPSTPGATEAAELTDGEVRKVDREAGKLTLRHGEIRNLDMPPMTMVFEVRDPALLEQLKPGDKVRFRVVDEAGAYVVTEIQPAP